ncbi:MAG: LuxR C-terminal-related transcriptional regulator [Chthoniobacterales bacterium]
MTRSPLSSVLSKACRVLLIDGMEVFRIGLAQVVASIPQLLVCATTGDYGEIPQLIERHRPHLLIAEPFRNNEDGIFWIKDLHGRFPRTKILVASSNSESTYAERILRAGASGYWMKDGTSERLHEAIQTVLAGEIWVSPRVGLLAVRKLVAGSEKKRDLLSQLSNRELTIFTSIGAGHGTGQIARELGISRKTVETHCAHIKLKLGYRSAAALKRGASESLG